MNKKKKAEGEGGKYRFGNGARVFHVAGNAPRLRQKLLAEGTLIFLEKEE